MNSLAIGRKVNCQQCGQVLDVEVWEIVDAAERPDLMEQLRGGILHAFLCSHCGFENHVEEPLLVFQPQAPYPILYSPVTGEDPEASQQHLEALILHLYSTLREDWQDAWFVDGIQTVNRENLIEGLNQNLLQASLQEISQLPGIQDVNQRLAIFERAFQVITRQNQPRLWAALQDEYAKTLLQNLQEPRAENIEKAITTCEQALTVFTREGDPGGWASTQHTLGNAYLSRIDGERTDNVDQAIDHYQQALVVFTRQYDPEWWGILQNNLAKAFDDRVRGDRAENTEVAIHYYHQALEVFTRQADPARWATLQNNLGTAFRERMRGDPSENIEQALSYYEKSLEVKTRQAYPEDWALIQNNLGRTFLVRTQGEKAENFEKALEHCQQALLVYQRQMYPESWALTHKVLGEVYRERLRGVRAENIEKSLAYFHDALEVATREAYPHNWAELQHELAKSYRYRMRGSKADNMAQAIHHYRQALEVYTRQADPLAWAAIQYNLAVAFQNRTGGDREANIAEAIAIYRQVLEVFRPQVEPEHSRLAGFNLGKLGFELRNWDLVIEGYGTALTAHEIIFPLAASRARKENMLREMHDTPACLAYALAKKGRSQEAVETVERGRAQLLREGLARNRKDLDALPGMGFEELYTRYEAAMATYNNLVQRGEAHVRPPGWQVAMEKAQDETAEVEREIRARVGKDHPEFRYFNQPLPFDVIQAQSVDAALVYILATSDGGLALVVSGNGVLAIWLEDLKYEDLVDLIIDEEGSSSYLRSFRSAHWRTHLEPVLGWLWKNVMAEVLQVVLDFAEGGVPEIVLIPTGLLGLLPLHAAYTVHQGIRMYALDKAILRYVPSVRALLAAKAHAADQETDGLLALENPDGSLRFSGLEMQAAQGTFTADKTCHLVACQVTESAVRREMGKFPVLHFCTHGFVDFVNALQSGLVLAAGDILTLEEIYDLRLASTRLAILSACETGVPADLYNLDEAMSLPGGLIQAGVPAVIGSMWSVNDMSTALLMARFYAYWRYVGLAPQNALRQAQIWLRKSAREEILSFLETRTSEGSFHMPEPAVNAVAAYLDSRGGDPNEPPFGHPYWWAAFSFTGV